VTSAPYNFSLPSPALGTHTLTAVAVDGQGAQTTSSARTFIVSDQNQAPTVSIFTPLDNSRWHAPAGFMFQASANSGEANDTVTVEFYVNGVLQGTDATAPYSINLSNLAAGTYTLSAKAIDGQGAQTTSAARTVIVSDTNNPPTVSITAPAGGANFPTAPAAFTINATANAGEVNGWVTRVEFYVNGALVNTDTAGPWSYAISGLGNGTYQLTAKAVDQLSAETVSAPITVTVGPQPKGYFIHADHLNTPRLITDQQGQEVWRWDNTEPFGDSVPNENPGGLGVFEQPLALAGTYRDKEIGGKLYNWNRTADPALGRYLQSDLMGLNGGMNTYLHLGANPLSRIDLMGFVGESLGGGRSGGPGIGFPNVSGQAAQNAAGQIQKIINSWFCPPDCADIQAQIDVSIATLRVRYLHMTADVNNLYCLRPTGKFSWFGHQFAYNNERKHLEKLVAQAKQRGCPYDPEAEEWIRRDPPTCPAR
jgi:RHS repeat-associated protein